ncbi:MAG: hypothetical protein IAG10_20460 [Planctomycetaceae bacterium]|nr:hypothetical protein [Planctomycetaceae bacterium]
MPHSAHNVSETGDLLIVRARQGFASCQSFVRGVSPKGEADYVGIRMAGLIAVSRTVISMRPIAALGELTGPKFLA